MDCFTEDEHRELRALNEEAEALVKDLAAIKLRTEVVLQKARSRRQVEEMAEPLAASRGGSLSAE